MSAATSTAADTVARIVRELPLRPTDADLLRALVRAELAGYQRRQAEEGIAAALSRIRLSSSRGS